MTDVLSVEEAINAIIKAVKESITLKPGEKFAILKCDAFVLVEAESNIVASLKVFMIHYSKRKKITQDMLIEIYDGSAYDITIRTIGYDA